MSWCTPTDARWVATDCCQPFDEALAQPPAEAMAGPEGGAAADGGRYSQALKLAVQLHRCGQEVRLGPGHNLPCSSLARYMPYCSRTAVQFMHL